MAQRYLVHVRSADCTSQVSGYNTSLLVNLKSTIRCDSNEAIRVSISNAEIPFTWYSFSTDLLTDKMYVDGASSLVLTAGNYDIFELVVAVNAASWPYDMSYNVNTSKVTLTNTDATNHTINFSHSTSAGLARLLGFAATDQAVLAGGSTTGANAINLQAVHSLFITTNLNVNNIMSTRTGNYENIIDQIPVDVTPFNIIHYNYYKTSDFSAIISEKHLSAFSFSIRDQSNNLIQLNGTNYEICFQFDVISSIELAAAQAGVEFVNKRPRIDY